VRLGDEPNMRLRCLMLMLMRFVLVPVYVRNKLITHLCRLFAELLMVVGPCPMHCSLILFMFEHKCVCYILKG